MDKVRIQKIIADAGICSRRKAESLIKAKRIRVNGKISNLGDKANPLLDEIKIDEEKVNSDVTYRVILLNKPCGVITSCKDQFGRKTVLDLIPDDLRKGIHPIGRLDLNSRGALLLTNNGELTQKLTHPSFNHEKTYLVWVKGVPSKDTITNWSKGIDLDGQITRKVNIRVIDQLKQKSLLRISMREGRNRQIRRIAEKLSHPVVDLQRVSIANLHLGNLDEGSWKLLSKKDWIPLLF